MLSRLRGFSWGGVTFLAALAAMAFAQNTVRYTPDSFIYARMMLEDRGLTTEEATEIDRRFFLKQFEREPWLRTLVGVNPPRYFQHEIALFVNRPLYPYLASLLFGRLGFRAMPFVSSVAYVLAAVTLFRLLSCFGPEWLACMVTISAVTMPTVSVPTIFELGTYALTDMLALLFSIVALLAQVRYALTGNSKWSVVLLASAASLALTRPAVYVVVGAAVAVSAFGWRRNRIYAARGAVMSAIALSVSVAYTIYLVKIGAPGLTGQLAYLYERHMSVGTHRGAPLAEWYALQVARTIIYEARSVALRPLALLTAALGLYGLIIRRMNVGTVCVIGALISLSVAILTNPVPGDSGRPLEVPMIPILAVGVVSAVADWRRAKDRQKNGG